MGKSNIIIAAVFGFTGVALGAFGAHVLGNFLQEELMKTFNTGVQYHLLHAVVMLILAIFGRQFGKSFRIIFSGTILFSFSLYLYVLTGLRFAVMLTPVGGILLLAGWLMIAYEGFKYKS